MNLAGNQAKQLFKSLRTGSSPSVVGLWAAATAVDQMRKRTQRPKKELIASKKLKPGESYVIRMPGKAEGALADSLAPETRVAEIETSGEGSIASQLFDAATDLIGAASQEPEATPEPVAASLSRRQRRKEAKSADSEAAAKLSRRQRRKADRAVAEEEIPAGEANGTLASTLADVAASFMTTEDDDAAAASPAKQSRRQRRRATRLSSLDEAEFDREALPRRRRRKLNRAERRAQKRPSRRRVRKARKRQKRAARTYAKIERRSQPSRRKRRKIRAAERDLEYRQAKVEKRSTRRRRRKLKKAEKAFEKLT